MKHSTLSQLPTLILSLLITLIATGCDSVDDERIPYAPVHITFPTVADWNIYGVKGDAADYARYIYSYPTTRIPANFPYTANDYTGYGGILLVTDVMGNLSAYDLACPYEVKPTIRVIVPDGELYAECPHCGSTFDIYTNHGNPRTGPAAERGYALKRYSVVSGGALEYRIVTR